MTRNFGCKWIVLQGLANCLIGAATNVLGKIFVGRNLALKIGKGELSARANVIKSDKHLTSGTLQSASRTLARNGVTCCRWLGVRHLMLLGFAETFGIAVCFLMEWLQEEHSSKWMG